jgi:hypothetical protein
MTYLRKPFRHGGVEPELHEYNYSNKFHIIYNVFNKQKFRVSWAVYLSKKITNNENIFTYYQIAWQIVCSDYIEIYCSSI